MMLNRLFPKRFDNEFRGHALAVWLLVPIVLVRLLQGVNCILDPGGVARSADAIPLDHFAPDASAMIVLLFCLSALSFLWLAAGGVIVLIRYRSMIPLTYLAFLADALARRALNVIHPTADAGPPGGHPIGFYVNLALLAAMVVGFVLSLIPRAALTWRNRARAA
jgi:hypothetical protein